MADYALVYEEEVKTVIVADAEFIESKGAEVAAQSGYPAGKWVLTDAKTTGINYIYDGAEFIPPEPEPLP